MTSWFLLVEGPRPGWDNMARDQALLELAHEHQVGVLRLYQWDPFCLSFGRHEPALRRYDRARLTGQGLDCVRRPTGGRAVWHARELTYSVTTPTSWWAAPRNAYRAVHQVFMQALAELGVETSLARPPERATGLDAGACFASPAGGEVLVGDAKVLGSAQVTEGAALLQHGSLLLNDDQRMVHDLTLGSPAPSRETPLALVLGRDVGFEEVAHRLQRAFADLIAPLTPFTDHQGLAERAGRHAARFRSPEWTWRR